MPLHLPPPAGGPPPMPTPMPVRSWSEFARSEWALLGEHLTVPQDLDPEVAAAVRSEWARINAAIAQREGRAIEKAAWNAQLADALRAPETDEEPWDVLDAAIVGTAWWAGAVAAVLGLLLLVLAVLGIRKAVRS